MIDLLSAGERFGDFQLRAWSGTAVDEGVGLIAIVEISDAAGRLLARFEEFLDATVHRSDPTWPRDDTAAARRLLEKAMDKARSEIAGDSLSTLNGHRFEVTRPD